MEKEKVFKVVCEDGRVRGGPFPTKYDAEQFSEWGHICTVGHKIYPVPNEKPYKCRDVAGNRDSECLVRERTNRRCPWCWGGFLAI